MINKLLTQKGWRVVAHFLLATTGITLLCLLSKMVMGDVKQEDALSNCILGVGFTFSLWLVALDRMLAKAELADRR